MQLYTKEALPAANRSLLQRDNEDQQPYKGLISQYWCQNVVGTSMLGTVWNSSASLLSFDVHHVGASDDSLIAFLFIFY